MKVVVFGLASLAVWDTGYHGWAVVLLAFSAVVNAGATVPQVREVAGRS